MVRVVAGLIEKDNKFFIAKRSTGDELNIGKWEFPGGKVNECETDDKALIRELKEELNIDVSVGPLLASTTYIYPNKTIELYLYKCTYINGNIKLDSHSEYKYVDKNDLSNYDLSSADESLLKLIKWR